MINTKQPANINNGDDKRAKDYSLKVKKDKNWTPKTLVFPSYDDIKISEGDSKAYVALCNPSINKAKFKYTIKRMDTQETLLKTGYIQPGKAVTEIPMSKNLKVGEYPLLFEIRAFNQSGKELNGTNLKLKLIVYKKTN